MTPVDARGPASRDVPPTLPFFLWKLLKEILRSRRYYLLLAWLLLATVGLLIFLSGTSAVLPAIYLAF